MTIKDMKTYTIEQIRVFLASVDSLGDASYFCDEEHIDKANEQMEALEEIEPEHGDEE